jgi:hypothetical protein
MKTKFIKINNISEIDPSKATVYDLNNRYIDSQGKMYSLKYNRRKRKIEIVRIIRTPVEAAPFYEQKLRESRKAPKSPPGAPSEIEEVIEEEIADTEVAAAEEGQFDPGEFITEALELMNTHKDRLYGIMVNINNSPIFSNIAPEISNDLQNLFRNMDIDGIQRIEKVITDHKELVSYPRSVSYYLTKLDGKDKKFAEDIGDENRQMRYIFLNEMFHAIRNLYRTLTKILDEVKNIFREINTGDMSNLTHLDKQNIDDAKTSIENTVSEIRELLSKALLLEEYLANPDNF